MRLEASPNIAKTEFRESYNRAIIPNGILVWHFGLTQLFAKSVKQYSIRKFVPKIALNKQCKVVFCCKN